MEAHNTAGFSRIPHCKCGEVLQIGFCEVVDAVYRHLELIRNSWNAGVLKEWLNSRIKYCWTPNSVLIGQDWDCFVKQANHWSRTAANSC